MFKDIINNLTNKITDKVNTIKEENNHYKSLLETSNIFENFFNIPNEKKEQNNHKINYITTECPDINTDKAKIITNLIPTEETYLTIIYSKEIKTNKEYYLIPTNKQLWIITPTTYQIYPYNISCQLIKNNLMSKTILLNNILLEASGNDTKINNLINILTNHQLRNETIINKTKYLCGITPIYQKINNNYGISLDNNSNIIFHTKDNNYKCTTSDIQYYEILLDNSIIYSNKNSTSTKISNFQNSCYQISVRITTKNNQSILIPILEPNTFNTKYQRTDTIFQNSLKFAEELIEKIKSIIPQNY